MQAFLEGGYEVVREGSPFLAHGKHAILPSYRSINRGCSWAMGANGGLGFGLAWLPVTSRHPDNEPEFIRKVYCIISDCLAQI